MRFDKGIPRARRKLFDRKRKAMSLRIDIRNNRFDFLIFFQDIFRMLDFLGMRNVGNVYQTVNAVFDFNKRAEIGQIANLTFNACSDLITLGNRVPGICLKLFHSKADAAFFGIDSQNLNFDFIARSDEFFRTLGAF